MAVLDTDATTIIGAINELHRENNNNIINAVGYGIKEGFNVDVTQNTTLFQNLINYCGSDKVIYFPSGNYVFNSVNLGEKRNITIKNATTLMKQNAKQTKSSSPLEK